MPRFVAPIILLLLLAGFGCNQGGTPEEKGERLYNAACARCHGDGLTGGIEQEDGSKSRNLADPNWQKLVTDEEMRQIIRNGRGQMPAFGKPLSLDKIDLIVKFIRSRNGS